MILLSYLFIFVARATDVSMATIRMLMVVQGRRVQAAIIGFFEIIIYVVALNQVMGQLDDMGKLMAYALGFASGNYFGCIIEERMALGTLTAEVILRHNADLMIIDTLRDAGFGVTVLNGVGREGEKKVLKIIFKRKKLKELHSIFDREGQNAFITITDVRLIRGGYFANQGMKKK